MTGTVDTWRHGRKGGRGYGFVTTPDGHRYFLPGKNLSDADLEKVTAGKRVEFVPRSPTGPGQYEVATEARVA